MTADNLVQDRISRLERRNRWTMSFLGVLIGVFLLAAGMQRVGPDAVRASSFEMVDSNGAVRAAIEMREGFPAIAVYDGNGQERILLTSTVSESAVFIKDSTGTTRLGMAQFAHGGGGFAAHGPESKGAAVLYLKGRGSLSFIDPDGNMVMRLPETQ
ncbi:MAG: hypothetical protein KJO98_09525 [Rhodothermia bacterium]|nr:hypothetical protein [Rhodothermia bacterium]